MSTDETVAGRECTAPRQGGASSTRGRIPCGTCGYTGHTARRRHHTPRDRCRPGRGGHRPRLARAQTGPNAGPDGQGYPRPHHGRARGDAVPPHRCTHRGHHPRSTTTDERRPPQGDPREEGHQSGGGRHPGWYARRHSHPGRSRDEATRGRRYDGEGQDAWPRHGGEVSSTSWPRDRGRGQAGGRQIPREDHQSKDQGSHHHRG